MSSVNPTQVSIPYGQTIQVQPKGAPAVSVSSDGQVDSCALGGHGSDACTGLGDKRLQDLVRNRSKHEASELGEGWKSSFFSLPRYGNRGINGMQEVSTFKSPSQQQVQVDWEKSTVSIKTPADQASTGFSQHSVQASFDRKGAFLEKSIQESVLL